LLSPVFISCALGQTRGVNADAIIPIAHVHTQTCKHITSHGLFCLPLFSFGVEQRNRRVRDQSLCLTRHLYGLKTCTHASIVVVNSFLLSPSSGLSKGLKTDRTYVHEVMTRRKCLRPSSGKTFTFNSPSTSAADANLKAKISYH
jgi:hypothetical protein